MSLSLRSWRRSPDIWPGFVDALAALLMILIFVLLVFVLSQFFLGQALSGRETENSRLMRELAALTEQLALETKRSGQLKADLGVLNQQLQSGIAERERLTHDVAALSAMKAELDRDLRGAEDRLGSLSRSAEAERALLSQQIEALRRELERVAEALEVSESQRKSQKTEIETLGARLNAALANRVEELKRYRSEFFGRLNAILGDRAGIRVEGDRFIVQSELLFKTGSAELGPEGARQIHRLASTLSQLVREIPKDVNWVLRVDGHTDRRPIATSRFPSNWELSMARAMSVVRAMALAGMPAERLAASGFGEFHPIDNGDTEAAYAKNRRIELRLDQK